MLKTAVSTTLVTVMVGPTTDVLVAVTVRSSAEILLRDMATVEHIFSE